MRRRGSTRPASGHALFALLAAALLSAPSVGQAADTHDLRVVIDISGSMKQTDPLNLRGPALR